MKLLKILIIVILIVCESKMNKIRTNKYHADNNGPDVTTVANTFISEIETKNNNTNYYDYDDTNETTENHQDSYYDYYNIIDPKENLNLSVTTEEIEIKETNCTGTLTYLYINQNSLTNELEITWDSNPSETCLYEYKITKTEMSSLQSTTLSININRTSYTFHDLKPCTKYNISVEMFLENNDNVLAKKTESFETDPIVFNQVENLTISSSVDSIWLSWQPPRYADICNIRYKIYASKEIPYYRYVNETQHWIKSLYSCTEYKISVTPSSMVRDESDDSGSSHFIEHTVSTLPERVQNLNLEFRNNKSKISWQPPEDKDCIKGYRIKTNKNAYNWTATTNSTFVEARENLFCSEIKIVAITENGKAGQSAVLTKPGPVQNLTESSKTNTSITVTWEQPEKSDCILDYVLCLNDQDCINNKEYSSETRYTFKNLVSCTEYTVKVAAKSKDNFIGNYESRNVATIYPKQINEVQNLSYVIQDNIWVDVQWKAPANAEACDIKYFLQILDDSDKVIYSGTTFDTDHPVVHSSWIKCMIYKITVRAKIETAESTLSNTTFQIPGEPGKIQHLNDGSPSFNTSITISWEPPKNQKCVYNYVLYLNNSEEITDIESTTNITEYTFDNLTACMVYTVGVAVNSSDNQIGDYESTEIITSYPDEIGQVQKLRSNQKQNQVVVQWEAPANVDNCIIEYSVELFNDADELVYNETTTEPYHLVQYTSWIGCMVYKIRVIAKIEETESQYTEVEQSYSTIPQPPTCVKETVQKTLATIKCEVQQERNLCPLQEVVIYCNASKSRNNGNWIKWNATRSQDIAKSSDTSFEINVNDLSEFTNYTCIGRISNSVGYSNPSEPIELKTEEGVPDAPSRLEVKPTGSRTIFMEWDIPENSHGVLTGYNITINSMNPQYFIPNDKNCSALNRTSHFIPVLANATDYTFLKALPMYSYEIDIQALTKAGPSNRLKTKAKTLAETPEQARNVDFNIETKDIKNYSVSVNMVWNYPCYTYGPIKNFAVYFIGISLVDSNSTNHSDTVPININEEPTNLDYNYTINNLKPAYNYTVYISVIPEGDIKESQASVQFNSSEAFPEAPVINKTITTTKNGIMLTWEEPPKKNGVIKNYHLELTVGEPIYIVFKDEECNKFIKNHSYDIPPSDNSFEFKDGKPYHLYWASVRAETSAGIGESSDLIKFQTLESEPEEVRKLNYEIKDEKVETYNVSAIISFKHPCNTNGLFDKFSITLLGSRLNYSSNEQKLDLLEQKEEYAIEFNELLPEYTYNVSIKVHTKNSESVGSFLVFLSPSGVPPETETINTPIPYDSTKANYTLDKNLFDSRFGEILYYALIVGTDDANEASKHGFWEGDENSWPKIKKQQNALGPYQVTPNLWNPFNEKDEMDTYGFVLGDQDLFESNVPLEPGVMYTLKVRGFTLHGYRDSPTVRFQMPALINLALILGLVLGIIGTAISLSFIIIWWRRRQQWNKKKESIKSILTTLTPIPVSIKQFPNHYKQLNNDHEKLKQEFTLLGTMSNERSLPAYDGLLPENKKKNRYTNIIPYDETRVKLVDINDNFSTTDYINASYIQGYSNNIEYIATQGPLEHTCMDFWKMIIQENTSLIVMVAQFVEQNKDKCYKYFPDNHENIELDNGICIRCCTELDFKTHIVRTLLVQKELQQWTVTHVQFTDWPDFGCPVGSEVLLEFCQMMREHAEKNSDAIVIHCSAGVGRTGTLIALDILLQAIHRNQDIDIFGTVLNLRRDRKNMVQTEKQYLFIHTCVNDVLENPLPLENGNDSLKEPIYENVNDIKKEYEDMDESKF